MNLCRLIYTSQSPSVIDERLIAAIEKTSAAKNKKLGITGVLLATRTRFLQVLEGDARAVNAVYRDILGDARHAEILLIGYQEVSRRQFADWTMKGIGLGLLGRAMARRLKEKYGVDETGDLAIPMDAQMAFALLSDVAYLLRGGRPA